MSNILENKKLDQNKNKAIETKELTSALGSWFFEDANNISKLQSELFHIDWLLEESFCNALRSAYQEAKTWAPTVQNQEIIELFETLLGTEPRAMQFMKPQEDVPTPHLHLMEWFENTGYNKLMKWYEVSYPSKYQEAKLWAQVKHSRKPEEYLRSYTRYELAKTAIVTYMSTLEAEQEDMLSKYWYTAESFDADAKTVMSVLEKIEKEIDSKYQNIEQKQEQRQLFEQDSLALAKRTWYDKPWLFQTHKWYYEDFSKKYRDTLETPEVSDSISFLEKPKIESWDDMKKYLNSMNIVQLASTKVEELKQNAWPKMLEWFENYSRWITEIVEKYWVKKIEELGKELSKYGKEIEELWNNSWVDMKKFSQAQKHLSQHGWNKKYSDAVTLHNRITDPQNPDTSFFKWVVRHDEEQKQKQAKTDSWYNYLKVMSPSAYQALQLWINWWNSLVDGIMSTWSAAWIWIMSLHKDDDELSASLDFKEKFDNFLKINLSTAMKEPPIKFYNEKWERDPQLNFTSDNTAWLVGQWLASMYVLLSWARWVWILAQFGKKWVQEWMKKWAVQLTKANMRKGLFTSAMIQQSWRSFIEAKQQWLSDLEASGYWLIMSTAWSALEMIAPNQLFFWQRKNVIRNLAWDWAEKSFYKMFAKHMTLELFEENAQESAQLGLQLFWNRLYNGIYDIDMHDDWSWQEFASTAIITTLTTWIVSTKWWIQQAQMDSGMSDSQKKELIESIKADPKLKEKYVNQIDKIISGKTKITGIEIEGLEKIKSLLHGNESAQRTEVPEVGQIIKQKIDEWKKIQIESLWKISIPPASLSAPNQKFNETAQAFADIANNRKNDIRQLDQIDNMDEFINKSFDLIAEEMWINNDPTLKIQVTEKDNYYSLQQNTVYISKNRAWHTKKFVEGWGDKAEIFGGICHELNHYLQWKEIFLNLDQWNQNRDYLYSELIKTDSGQERIQYILETYPDNIELQEYFKKAEQYSKNFMNNYISPNVWSDNSVSNYAEYKGQFVEKESFERWDAAVNSYREIVSYFPWKESRFWFTKKDVEKNSQLRNQWTEVVKQELQNLAKEKWVDSKLKLTDNQMSLVQQAHEVWWKMWGLSFAEIKQRRVLLEQVFHWHQSVSQLIRLCLESGICGNMISSEKTNAYVEKLSWSGIPKENLTKIVKDWVTYFSILDEQQLKKEKEDFANKYKQATSDTLKDIYIVQLLLINDLLVTTQHNTLSQTEWINIETKRIVEAIKLDYYEKEILYSEFSNTSLVEVMKQKNEFTNLVNEKLWWQEQFLDKILDAEFRETKRVNMLAMYEWTYSSEEKARITKVIDKDLHAISDAEKKHWHRWMFRKLDWNEIIFLPRIYELLWSKWLLNLHNIYSKEEVQGMKEKVLEVSKEYVKNSIEKSMIFKKDYSNMPKDMSTWLSNIRNIITDNSFKWWFNLWYSWNTRVNQINLWYNSKTFMNSAGVRLQLCYKRNDIKKQKFIADKVPFIIADAYEEGVSLNMKSTGWNVYNAETNTFESGHERFMFYTTPENIWRINNKLKEYDTENIFTKSLYSKSEQTIVWDELYYTPYWKESWLIIRWSKPWEGDELLMMDNTKIVANIIESDLWSNSNKIDNNSKNTNSGNNEKTEMIEAYLKT